MTCDGLKKNFAENLRYWLAVSGEGSREALMEVLGIGTQSMSRYLRGENPSAIHFEIMAKQIGFGINALLLEHEKFKDLIRYKSKKRKSGYDIGAVFGANVVCFVDVLGTTDDEMAKALEVEVSTIGWYRRGGRPSMTVVCRAACFMELEMWEVLSEHENFRAILESRLAGEGEQGSDDLKSVDVERLGLDGEGESSLQGDGAEMMMRICDCLGGCKCSNEKGRSGDGFDEEEGREEVGDVEGEDVEDGDGGADGMCRCDYLPDGCNEQMVIDEIEARIFEMVTHLKRNLCAGISFSFKRTSDGRKKIELVLG